jgi:hypothetical protein
MVIRQIHMKTKTKENGVLLFMVKRKRIRKTIRMVLREAKREQKEELQNSKATIVQEELTNKE